ncbi:mannose-6-phosphate isomerase [Pullulanibacillus pueri]|uniref:Mannose-6-phosphate isomerase n=1 Tax=Pullulanibacillus pueri TaxID=1437324 RepID=A0A8J3ENK5_9BACL|nr:type I phosphomannose isomerase catalytic subunit [Pullulanibacillus pueri]MBM7683522.1 mannose-6-phosphate isomerase [Pullulanibacillus pueri]GGH86925.1 mannose-6-phosphate isomerase [Pullulanibacillus pueri]
MYPIKFDTIYISKPWGSRKLREFKPNLPKGIIGETWEISCHPENVSIIANGQFKGMKLTDLIELEGQKLLGTKIESDWFPLMLRYVSAEEKLSIQVHPTDEFAHEKKEPMGKVEAWYILDAKEGAFLYAGVQTGDKTVLKRAALNGTIENYLKKVYVEKGDVVFIPSGLIHAICEDVTLVELCCNSNTTYRIYDYSRGRGLDLEYAFQVADLKSTELITKGLETKRQGYTKSYLCLDKHFAWENYTIEQSLREKSDPERFYLFTCVEGNGRIIYNNTYESINSGETFLIPAQLGEYTFEGRMKVLKSYVPKLDNVREEILREIEYGSQESK